MTVNPGDPSRAIAFVSTEFGPALASVDANDDSISFFALRSTGFVKVASLPTGSEPAQILSADLDGNGVTDLIVRNAGDGTIWVFPGDGNGWFLPPRELPVGVGASDIEVADLEQNGRLDIVYTDRLAGEVGVLENLGGELFAPRCSIAPAQGRTASPGRPTHRRSRAWKERRPWPSGRSPRMVCRRWSHSTRARTPWACSRAWGMAASPTRPSSRRRPPDRGPRHRL